MLLVVTAEVRRLVVPDAEPGTGGVEMLAQHQAPSLPQAQLLLELQRTEVRDRLEVVVES